MASSGLSSSKIDIKSHVAGQSLMKAIRFWTKDPSQPPAVKVGILCTQTDVNRAIETQTEIGWLHMFFAGFVSIFRLGTCQFRRGDHNKPQRRMFYLFEPGQTCSQESIISRCTTCFCQCLSENGNTGSSRLPSFYLDWSQRCTLYENLRH